MTTPFIETEAGLRSGDFEIVWARNSKEFFFANSFVIHGKGGLIADP